MSNEISGNTLSYFIPDPGRRKANIRVPESHSLHVCPSACSRRNAIHALERGDKENVSFLYITETDVVSGHYEEIIGDAVQQLLGILKQKPKIFLLYVNCIDDFLGTDENALLMALRKRFPALRFALCHINPVSLGKKIMPGMLLHSKLFSFLEPSEKRDNGVNLIGNFVSPDPDCELLKLLEKWGAGPIRQLFECKSYEQYEDMARSKLNLVQMFMGELAAQEMERKIGTPYHNNYISYDPDDIAQNYCVIAGLLGKERPDFSEDIAAAREEIETTRIALDGFPVVIDSSATMRPFALVKMLICSGFNVQYVFAMRLRDIDLPDVNWLKENNPDLKIQRTESYEGILGFGIDQDCICIGRDSAYMLQARHYVDMWHDEGFYGFHGVQKLMRMLRTAAATDAKWPELPIPGKNGKD